MIEYQTKINIIQYAPIGGAILSIIGSSLTLLTIQRSKSTGILLTTYHRLIMGICIFDLFFSMAMALGPYPAPKEIQAYGYTAAQGTIQTCTIQGFFLLLGNTSFAYTTMLMIYYVLMVVGNVKESTMKYSYEPILHFIPIVFYSIATMIGLLQDMINFSGAFCFIGAYPLGCIKNPNLTCERGGKVRIYSLYVGTIPILIWNIISATSLVLVGCTVFVQYQKSRKYRSIWQLQQQHESQIKLPPPPPPTSEVQQQVIEPLSPSSKVVVVAPPPPNDQALVVEKEEEEKKSEQEEEEPHQQEENSSKTMIFKFRASMLEARAKTSSRNISNRSNSTGDTPQTVLGGRSTTSRSGVAGRRSTNNTTSSSSSSSTSIATFTQRQVLVQCGLYAIQFLNVAIWISIVSIQELIPGSKFNAMGDEFWIFAIAITLFPMQGFFLFLIFIRPRYINVRTNYYKTITVRLVQQQERNNNTTTTTEVVVEEEDVSSSTIFSSCYRRWIWFRDAIWIPNSTTSSQR